jgi:hypothetical protein
MHPGSLMQAGGLSSLLTIVVCRIVHAGGPFASLAPPLPPASARESVHSHSHGHQHSHALWGAAGFASLAL